MKKFGLFCILLICFSVSLRNAPQAIEQSYGGPIPKDSFKSWSLFLISNPEWILPESNEKVTKLYERFKAFGAAIGPDHLAVWFWSKKPSGNFLDDLDVIRSSAFCSQLKLPPSKSPYILVTTEYPGAGLLSSYPDTFHEFKNFFVLELNGLDASEITQLLTKLADQLLIEDIVRINPKSKKYWQTWQKSFESIRNSLVGFSKKIKITINTSFFKVEIEH